MCHLLYATQRVSNSIRGRRRDWQLSRSTLWFRCLSLCLCVFVCVCCCTGYANHLHQPNHEVILAHIIEITLYSHLTVRGIYCLWTFMNLSLIYLKVSYMHIISWFLDAEHYVVGFEWESVSWAPSVPATLPSTMENWAKLIGNFKKYRNSSCQSENISR